MSSSSASYKVVLLHEEEGSHGHPASSLQQTLLHWTAISSKCSIWFNFYLARYSIVYWTLRSTGIIYLPSHMEPCLTKPTMSDVHWLHFVGVVNVLTENLCTRGCWIKTALPLLVHAGKGFSSKIIPITIVRHELDCRTVGFFLKTVKKDKVWRKSLTRAKRASLICPSVSLTVFSLSPDLLFECSRVLEYAKIRTVLQSTHELKMQK